MTAITYTVNADNWNTNDSISMTTSDTLEILRTANIGVAGYALYNYNSAGYPAGTYPADFKSATYWTKWEASISVEMLYSAQAISLPAGSYTFGKAMCSYGADNDTGGGTLTVNVTEPAITVSLTAGHTYVLSSAGSITASLSGTTLTVSAHTDTFDIIDLGIGTGSNIVVIAATSDGVTTL